MATSEKEQVSGERNKYLELDELFNEIVGKVEDVSSEEVVLYENINAMEKDKSLDAELENLIKDERLFSKFQIMDEMVERISEVLEERGITEFDPESIRNDVAKWIPRQSIKDETPPEFVRRVYGEFRGVTMAAINDIDDKLYEAYRTWLKKQPKGKRQSIVSPVPLKPDLGLKTPPTPYQSYGYRRVMAFYNKKYA